MPSVPELQPSLFIGAAIGAWLLAIVGILVMRWHYSRRLDRMGEATSEEIINELGHAYKPTPRVRVQTQTEYLPYVIETIRENVDSGIGDQQAELLIHRIENHRQGAERQAIFPIETRARPSDLRFTWTCDSDHRIDLLVQGDPVIVRALRDLKRRIPKAAAYGQAGHS